MTKVKIIAIVVVCVLLCTLAIGGLVYLLRNKLPSKENQNKEPDGIVLLDNEISSKGTELSYTQNTGMKMKAIRMAPNTFAE